MHELLLRLYVKIDLLMPKRLFELDRKYQLVSVFDSEILHEPHKISSLW